MTALSLILRAEYSEVINCIGIQCLFFFFFSEAQKYLVLQSPRKLALSFDRVVLTCVILGSDKKGA